MRRIIGIIPLILLIFIALMLIPRFDGTLSSLQRHFSTNRTTQPIRKNETVVLFAARQVGAHNFTNCISVAISKDGIYFYLEPPFGILLKPVFIPWEEIKAYSLTYWGDSTDTNVWIPRAGVEIAFKQSAKQVLGHCERLKIPKMENVAMQQMRVRGT